MQCVGRRSGCIIPQEIIPMGYTPQKLCRSLKFSTTKAHSYEKMMRGVPQGRHAAGLCCGVGDPASAARQARALTGRVEGLDQAC